MNRSDIRKWVRFRWSELRAVDHGGRAESPLARAASDVHESFRTAPGAATATLLLARAFLMIYLKEKRTLRKWANHFRNAAAAAPRSATSTTVCATWLVAGRPASSGRGVTTGRMPRCRMTVTSGPAAGRGRPTVNGSAGTPAYSRARAGSRAAQTNLARHRS